MADDKPKVSVIKLVDLIPDANNANEGTERGTYMLDRSLTEVGAGRSITADRNNQVPAGNKTLQAAIEAGFEEGLLVESDGKRLVIVKRTDWDLEDPDPNNPARRYAYMDNRSNEVSLKFSPIQIATDLEAGTDLSDLWFDWELEVMMGSLGDEPIDPEAEWQGMPEFEQDDLSEDSSIKVNFTCPEDRQAFAELIGQKITDKTRSIWYPEAEIARFADKRWVNES